MKESEEKIKKYLEEEYQLNDYELEVKDGWIIINTESDVKVPEKLEKLFPFEKVKFGKVGGNFSCEDCSSLTSLEGAPEKVGGIFYCYNCSALTSLEGAPEKVGGNFYCNNCSALTSLEGAPGKVVGNFCFQECTALTSLKGAPEKVGGFFAFIDCSSLTSLEGAPEKVGCHFYCYKCSSLTSLKGATKEVGGDFSCIGCSSLTSLEGAPEKVGGNFYCYYCSSLTSLEGAPEKVGGRMIADKEYNSDFDEYEEFEYEEFNEDLVYLTEILARFINQGGLELSDKDKDELYKQVIRDAGFNFELQDFKDQLQDKIDTFESDLDQIYYLERLCEIVHKILYSVSMDELSNAAEDVILADGKITIDDIYELNHIMDAQEYHSEQRFIFYGMFFEKVVEMAKKGKLKIVENHSTYGTFI